jgi:hypothetical protein
MISSARVGATGIAVSHSLAKLLQAKRRVPMLWQEGGQQTQRGGIGRVDQFAGRWRGGGHIEHPLHARTTDQDGRATFTGAGGQAGARAGALATIQKPLIAELGEGGGDGGAADLEDVGQLPFPWQHHIQWQTAIQDEQPQPVGQLPIGGAGPLAPPGAEQADQRGGSKASRAHGAKVAELALFSRSS